jgi:hypothetical protein
MVIARMFPWNFGSVVGDHPPSIHAEDLEDIRERQELAFVRNIARNTSNTTVGEKPKSEIRSHPEQLHYSQQDIC